MTDPINTPPATPPAPPAAPKLPPYFRTVNPDESASIVAREELTQGAIVKFIGTRKVENRGMGRMSTIHTFYARGGEGLPFALWGSSELDSQLRKLRGSVVFLKYNGKHAHPTVPDRTVHKWTVQEAVGARVEHIRKVREGFAEQEAALDAAIGAAVERDKARLAAGGPGLDEVPPPDDSDLPF